MISAKPIVFVVRLTAIGDTLITARALAQLQTAGFEPILVTSQAQIAVAEAFTPVRYCVLQQSNGELKLMLKSEKTAPEVFPKFKLCEENAWTQLLSNEELINTNHFNVLDLQNTARSKRAVANLKNKMKQAKFKVQKVPKRTLFRIFLMVVAFFKFSQKVNSKAFDRKNVKSIHEIQRAFVHQFIQNEFAKRKASNESQLPLLARVSAGNQKVERVLQTESLEFSGLGEISGKKYVAIFPGASGPLKTWPKENYRACIDHMLAQSDFDIVICGGAAEKEIANYLAFSSSHRIFNFAGSASLAQTLSIISHAQHVITGDSFATHAADLAGISATVLFGGTSPYFGFVPLSSNIEIAYSNLSCSPCTRHGKGECRFKNLKCLAGMSGVEIANRVLKNKK